MSTGRLHALDGLRGVAAIAVMLMHAQLASLPISRGYLAVDLFFVLSGFVIARSYEPQLQRGSLDLRGYVLVRLERLYPMLFLGGAIGVALYAAGLLPYRPAGGGELALALAGQFLLIPFTVPGFSFVFNGPQWSIVLELLANFGHALALPMLGNRMLALLIAICALGLLLTARRFGHLNIGFTRDGFVYGLPRVGFGFLAGVLLCRTHASWSRFVPATPFVVPAAGFVGVAMLVDLAQALGAWSGSYDCVAVLLLFPLLTMLGVEASGGRVATALGTLSYPIYAIHYQTFGVLHARHAPEGLVWGVALALLPVAWGLGKWVDEPLNAWRRRSRKAAKARLDLMPA
ncbi:MAG: acyltransferase [Sphingomonadales bacterium]|nr:acyltransferase [Sphingomonadales bacterium]